MCAEWSLKSHGERGVTRRERKVTLDVLHESHLSVGWRTHVAVNRESDQE